MTLTLALALLSPVHAQSSGGGGGGITGFGIGVIAGEPTGLSLGFGLNSRNKVQSHLSWSLAKDRARVSVDYLFNITNLSAPDLNADIPLYIGVGGLLGAEERRFWYGATAAFGVRVPFGVSVVPASVPIDIFAELAPVFYMIPSTALGLEGGIGVRFWF